MSEKQLRALLDALYDMCSRVDGGDVDAWNLQAHMVTVALQTIEEEPARSWLLAWKRGEVQ